jgi:hypothetical protein
MTAVELRAHADRLRAAAARGVTQVTHNGKTIRYPEPGAMLDVADRLEDQANKLETVVRSPCRPSRMIYSRR